MNAPTVLPVIAAARRLCRLSDLVGVEDAALIMQGELLTVPVPEQATTVGPQRPALAPENVQEPRTPTPGSPGTPETLSVPLSAPNRPTDGA